MCACEQSSDISLRIRSRDLLGKNNTENMQLYQTSHFLLESDSNRQFNLTELLSTTQNSCPTTEGVYAQNQIYQLQLIHHNCSSNWIMFSEGSAPLPLPAHQQARAIYKSSCWTSRYLMAGCYGRSVSSACSAFPLSHSDVLLASSHIMHYSWGEKRIANKPNKTPNTPTHCLRC